MVHTSENALRLGLGTVEMRFDDGMRYYDRCGAVVSQIRQLDRRWMSAEINQATGVLVHESNSLVIRLTHEQLIISKNGDGLISHLHGETLARSISEQVDAVYQLVTSTLAIPNTTRVGARFAFVALADSLEDAQVFINARAKSKFRDSVETVFSSKAYSGRLRFEIEEEESGYRRNVSLLPIERPRSTRTNPQGLVELEPPCFGVSVDVDLFTRPTEGHLPAVGAFVTRAFNSAREGSLRLLHTN